MPLVAISLVAYVAGLLSGFAGSLRVIPIAVVAGVVLGARRSPAVAAALGGLVVAGAVVARSATGIDARCLADAARRSTLFVVVDDSIGPGVYGHARLADCAGRVSFSVQSGDAPAGATVSVRGDVIASRRGLVVQHATVRLLRGAPLFPRMRTAAGRAIDRTFRDDAPLVRALLIADRQQLTPELRDSFAAAGLAHVLAIAGLHIGILAAAIALTFELLGMSRLRAATITIAVVIGYVLVIGAPIPAVRSATMLTVWLVSRLTQRPTSRWVIVAIGASQPLLHPRVALEAGYQLSVVGVVAMMAAGRFCKRLDVGRLPAAGSAVVTILVGTTIATIASAPIVAWVFGRVSLIAPLSNLFASPLIALAQPIIFCGLLLSPIHAAASLFADAAHPLLSALTTVASTSAGVPHASLAIAPTVPGAVLACIVSGGVIAACVARTWRPPAALACVAGTVLIWLPLTPSRAGLVELHMLDVGQGDAIALRTSHGHWILFDAGPGWRGGDAGRSTILPYLGRRGGSLDLFVLSHPHTDHVGGAATVLRALHPAMYVDAGFPGAADAYRASLAAARMSHVQWVRAHPGDSIAIDGVAITFLAPDSTWTASLADPNLASVVALVRVGRVRMLLMGDAERPEEDWLLAHDSAGLHADILKVGHHGSSTSTSAPFLRAVHPRLALVSVGAGNVYRLPSANVMRALAAQGAQVLRTDRIGTIVARTDGEHIFVDAAGDSWELPRASEP